MFLALRVMLPLKHQYTSRFTSYNFAGSSVLSPASLVFSPLPRTSVDMPGVYKTALPVPGPPQLHLDLCLNRIQNFEIPVFAPQSLPSHVCHAFDTFESKSTVNYVFYVFSINCFVSCHFILLYSQLRLRQHPEIFEQVQLHLRPW